MATGPNFAPPLPLMQPPACRLLDPPNSPPIDPFLADRLRNHRHLAIAPPRMELWTAGTRFLLHRIKTVLKGRVKGIAEIWSERRDSNPRHSPWQGDALPD